MVRLSDLQARVTVGYAGLGMPTWPNPHPEGLPPVDEEYSRVTQPARYRIVHARARVWARVLGELPGVEVATLAPGPCGGGVLDRFDRGARVGSARPGTLPLLLLERDVPTALAGTSSAVLHISVARPQVTVAMLPDCGCDACDWGSDDLLEAIDATIGSVVGGPFVALRGRGWQAEWHPDGGSSGGTGWRPDHTRVMELCRRLAGGEDVPLPAGTEAFVGRPWFG